MSVTCNYKRYNTYYTQSSETENGEILKAELRLLGLNKALHQAID